MARPVLVFGSGWARHAACAFASDARVQLGGIVARGSPRSIALAGAHGVPLFTDIEQAIDHIAPELAAVAVNEREHPAIVERLLMRGCHVLCSHPVARDSGAVGALAELAQAKRLVAATDYTLRLQPAFAAARKILHDQIPLRIAIRCPGRAMVIAIDLAIALAGPVADVIATGRYPAHLDERRRRAPSSFPPTVLLEHNNGCVTSLVPIPHAERSRAHRVEISTESCRIDLDLPSGGARQLVLGRRGATTIRQLMVAEAETSSEDAFGEMMRRLAQRFVDAVVDDTEVHAPLSDEVHVRAVWEAIEHSSPRGSRRSVVTQSE